MFRMVHMIGSCSLSLHEAKNRISKQQILFVDLAGSERIAKSRVDRMRQQEALNINGALSTLGRVIKALGADALKKNDCVDMADMYNITTKQLLMPFVKTGSKLALQWDESQVVI